MRQWRMLFGAAIALLATAGVTLASRQEPVFPHAKHERLFPVCQGCHEGIISGDSRVLYPPPNTCANCHDGTRAKEVRYTPPVKRASNLSYSHIAHDSILGAQRDSATCQSCHQAINGEPTRMNVGAPQPATCIGCHAHKAETHLARSASCGSCHVPLAKATQLSSARVAGFPRPVWHDTANFLSLHGTMAASNSTSCSTCHARETCERCHINAIKVRSIQSLEYDARVAVLEQGKTATYPKPPSHEQASWATAHGVTARRDAATCANCHTQPSCASCHLSAPGSARKVITTLAPRGTSRAQGVAISKPDVHPDNFATRHGVAAATGQMQCTQCHTQNTCSSCHAGSTSRAFHPANFVERHSAQVFAGSGSCQSCHNTETFCRACHTQMGIASRPNMNAAYHNAQPMWVLSHGQAARTSMETCASCHRQNDCVRCHSAVGGWRVNPHGPSFPASRLAARNASSCKWCHSTSPVRGN